ncbi:hypothetical protein E2C01_033347 [Portunus trituberculatus]|uniref:Ig-like domain-containing protein n=1 Tax=Portunus trituberculatus TaxID=210409 RepID=A0A5B7F3T5_PORTR|nr:hypothetical protein [Portunus trituberculatus]
MGRRGAVEPCMLWGPRGLQAHVFESCPQSECRLGFLTRGNSFLAGVTHPNLALDELRPMHYTKLFPTNTRPFRGLGSVAHTYLIPRGAGLEKCHLAGRVIPGPAGSQHSGRDEKQRRAGTYVCGRVVCEAAGGILVLVLCSPGKYFAWFKRGRGKT